MVPITTCFSTLLICNYCITASHCLFPLRVGVGGVGGVEGVYVRVCVCPRNRCISHLSIIMRVNISDDVMVSDS